MAKRTTKQKQKPVHLKIVFSGTRALVCLVLLALLVGAYFFVPRWFPLNTDTPIDGDTDALVWHTVDVGQGDCTIVQFPDDKVLMVDAGTPTSYGAIVEYLDAWQITTIDWFVITHPHDDHYGSAQKLLENKNLKFNQLYCSSYPSTNKTYQFINDYDFQNPQNGDKLEGEDYTITFVLTTYSLSETNPNNASLMMTIEYYNKIFVLTGDSESNTDNDFINSATALNIFDDKTDKQIILKVAHHGAANGSSEKFLSFIFNSIMENNFALISCGKNNKYGHPTEAALNRIGKYVAAENILVTMDVGPIVVQTTASTLTINGTEAPFSTIAYSTIFITIGVVIVVLCFCQFNTKTTKRK